MPDDMKPIRVCLPGVLMLWVAMTLTGCFSLSHDAPPEQNYVLGESQARDTAGSAPDLAGLMVGLRQPEIADYLQTRMIVVREGPHEVRFAEFHRWGEELNRGILRTVAANLGARAPFESVDIVPFPPQVRYDYLIRLHVMRFEGVGPEVGATSDGEAYVQVSWEIVGGEEGSMLARGTTDYRADWQVDDYAGLVNLLDSGLRQVSDDLIAALEDLVTA